MQIRWLESYEWPRVDLQISFNLCFIQIYFVSYILDLRSYSSWIFVRLLQKNLFRHPKITVDHHNHFLTTQSSKRLFSQAPPFTPQKRSPQSGKKQKNLPLISSKHLRFFCTSANRPEGLQTAFCAGCLRHRSAAPWGGCRGFGSASKDQKPSELQRFKAFSS